MTTNQTIDGVPRELLERIAESGGYVPRRAELRALLDAPAEPAGSLISVKPDVLRALFAPNANSVQLRDAKDAARKAYEDWSIAGQHSSAKPQGEPVAWIKADVAKTLHKDECCYAFGSQNPKGTLVPLYAEQTAPVEEEVDYPHDHKDIRSSCTKCNAPWGVMYSCVASGTTGKARDA